MSRKRREGKEERVEGERREEEGVNCHMSL